MQMWQSAFGMDATPEAMVETLQRIPIAKDIVDRINEHCEWICMIEIPNNESIHVVLKVFKAGDHHLQRGHCR